MTHSWFGNDVGCRNWDNFWINEGLNTFMERKTLSILRSPDFAKIDYQKGNVTMYEQMVDWYGVTNSYSSLFPNIGDDDPENSFSKVPYEKGSQFVYYLETLLGEDMMQTLLQTYMGKFQQTSIDQMDFQAMYEEFVNANFENATEIISMTDWETWVTVPGLPPVTLNFTTAEADKAVALANEYVLLGGQDSPANFSDFSDYWSSQKVVFVQTLSQLDGVDAELLAYIDGDLSLSGNSDPELKTEWYILGISKGYDAVLEPCRAWMSEQGRNAYVRPTYTALVDAGMCDTAQEWFAENEDFYNSYVVGRVQRALEACSGESTESPSGDPDTESTEPPTTSGSVDIARMGDTVLKLLVVQVFACVVVY